MGNGFLRLYFTEYNKYQKCNIADQCESRKKRNYFHQLK